MSASPRFYLSDPKLLPRLRQYLDGNGKCDVDSMVTHLISTYSEYRRKKVNSLKSSVEKARLMLVEDEPSDKVGCLNSDGQRNGSQNENSQDENSFSSDGEYVEYQDHNKMNGLLTSMYKSTSSGASTPQPLRSNTSSAAASPRPSSKKATDNPLPFFIDKVGDRSRPDQQHSGRKPHVDRQLGFIKKGPSAEAAVTTPRSAAAQSSLPCRVATDCEETPVNAQYRPASSQSEKRLGEDRQASHKKLKKFKPSSPNSPAHQPAESSAIPVTADAAAQESGSTRGEVETPHPAIAAKVQKPIKSTGATSKGAKSESRKTKTTLKDIQHSTVRFADIGGNEETILKICKMLVHMKHPEVYAQIGVIPPRGFLLHGPPGCGKTLLANAVAGELQLPLIKLAATEVVSGVSGESEERLRDLFDQAVAAAPCVLFIDEIDAITPKRETASKDMERRIVAQLLSCMDELSAKSTAHVLVIGATNRPDSLDAALRRAGRFDHEICLGIPGEAARKRILEVLCRNLQLHESCDLAHIARLTPGFVGADLMALTRDAAMVSIERILSKMQPHVGLAVEPLVTVSQPDSKERADDQHSSPDRILVDANNTAAASAFKSQLLPAAVEPAAVEPAALEPAAVEPAAAVPEAMDGSGDSNRVPLEIVSDFQLAKQKPKSSLTDVNAELLSVLSWLRECPPLSSEQLQDLCVLPDDFKEALEHVQPSSKREGFATVPDVTWADIGALHAVRKELQMAVLAPIKYPEYFQTLGLASPSGILLAGPPGCGKTLLAKAIANESGINFISVKGPELLNMYVGESERAVRQVFQRARNSVPCVIFFDELDALCPRRSDSGEGGSSVRVVNQLLTEMDGLETRRQVFVLGATNRPDIIDPAVLRPGRLDKVLYVDLPSSDERLDILRTITKSGRPPLAADVNLRDIATAAENYTGADISALVREASLAAVEERMTSDGILGTHVDIAVCKGHFEVAFSKVKPSVSPKDRALYSALRLTLSHQ